MTFEFPMTIVTAFKYNASKLNEEVLLINLDDNLFITNLAVNYYTNRGESTSTLYVLDIPLDYDSVLHISSIHYEIMATYFHATIQHKHVTTTYLKETYPEAFL